MARRWARSSVVWDGESLVGMALSSAPEHGAAVWPLKRPARFCVVVLGGGPGGEIGLRLTARPAPACSSLMRFRFLGGRNARTENAGRIAGDVYRGRRPGGGPGGAREVGPRRHQGRGEARGHGDARRDRGTPEDGGLP